MNYAADDDTAGTPEHNRRVDPTPWIGRCAECRFPCNDGRSFGWVTVQVGSRQARVHSVCAARFEQRPAADQYERAL